MSSEVDHASKIVREAFGVRGPVAHAMIKQLAAYLADRGMRISQDKKKLREERDDALRKGFKDGYSVAELRAKLGVTKATAYRALKIRGGDNK